MEAKYRRMTEQDDQYVKEHYEEKSYKEMANDLGLNLRQIQHAMHRLNLQKNIWSINHYKKLTNIYKNQLEKVITELESTNNSQLNNLIDECKDILSEKTLEEVGKS